MPKRSSIKSEIDSRFLPVIAAFAKDRDVTIRVTRSFSADTGVYEFTGHSVADEGPPPTSDHVRVRESAGRWRLVPAPDGGTDVSYVNRTDAGVVSPAQPGAVTS